MHRKVLALFRDKEVQLGLSIGDRFFGRLSWDPETESYYLRSSKWNNPEVPRNIYINSSLVAYIWEE